MSEAACIFLIAGEESGDQLGGPLMQALSRELGAGIRFAGIGGERMLAQGLAPVFPMRDIAVMGFLPVLQNLRTLLARIDMAAQAILTQKPDAVVMIDAPDFTHRVARKVRKAAPSIPILNYVSPSVWAWRPGRARKMRGYMDHVMALLPFEPAAHQRLGGPPCTYVGHPLIERLGELRPGPEETQRREAQPPLLLLLPGSRRSEIDRLMPVFGETLAIITGTMEVEPVLPAVARHREKIEALMAAWPVKARLVDGEAEKLRAFRSARAALAASGTVTLELALAHVPSTVAYKVSKAEEFIARRLIQVPSIVLPNLILNSRTYPEHIQADCTPQRLAADLLPLLGASPARDLQLADLAILDALMRLSDGGHPSEAAARIVLETIKAGRG